MAVFCGRKGEVLMEREEVKHNKRDKDHNKVYLSAAHQHICEAAADK